MAERTLESLTAAFNARWKLMPLDCQEMLLRGATFEEQRDWWVNIYLGGRGPGYPSGTDQQIAEMPVA